MRRNLSPECSKFLLSIYHNLLQQEYTIFTVLDLKDLFFLIPLEEFPAGIQGKKAA